MDIQYQCPDCGQSDCLEVVVQVFARVIQEPDNIQTCTDTATQKDHHWDEASRMCCRHCDCHGVAANFRFDPR